MKKSRRVLYMYVYEQSSINWITNSSKDKFNSHSMCNHFLTFNHVWHGLRWWWICNINATYLTFKQCFVATRFGKKYALWRKISKCVWIFFMSALWVYINITSDINSWPFDVVIFLKLRVIDLFLLETKNQKKKLWRYFNSKNSKCITLKPLRTLYSLQRFCRLGH